MTDLTQRQLNLGQIVSLQRTLEEYIPQLLRFANGTTPETHKEWVINMIASEHYLPSLKFKNYVQALSELNPDPELTNIMTEISRLMANLSDYTTRPSEDLNEVLARLKVLWLMWQDLIKPATEKVKAEIKKENQLAIYKTRSSHKTSNVVYHALKIDYLQKTLEENKIQGYTTHRHWEGGKRWKDNTKEYHDSYWMKGISTTRCLEYAIHWGPVVLVLDLEKIKEVKPVETYAWNFHLARGSGHFKKEREEFVVLSRKNKTYKNKDNPQWMEEKAEYLNIDPATTNDPEWYQSQKERYLEKMEELNQDEIREPEGELKLDKCLVGFFLVSSVVNIYGLENPSILWAINHPLFLGIVER